MNDFYYCKNGLPLPVHPDEVRECLGVLKFWAGDPGPWGEDAIARVVSASLSWRERRAAEERRHVRARERASAETRAILGQAEARRLALAHCERCADHYTPEGTER